MTMKCASKSKEKYSSYNVFKILGQKTHLVDFQKNAHNFYVYGSISTFFSPM